MSRALQRFHLAEITEDHSRRSVIELFGNGRVIVIARLFENRIAFMRQTAKAQIEARRSHAQYRFQIAELLGSHHIASAQKADHVIRAEQFRRVGLEEYLRTNQSDQSQCEMLFPAARAHCSNGHARL